MAAAAAAMGWRQGGDGEMWNSLSDVNVDSMTFCSYHSRKSVYRYISMFLMFILLISHLLFINSPLNAVFTFTLFLS